MPSATSLLVPQAPTLMYGSHEALVDRAMVYTPLASCAGTGLVELCSVTAHSCRLEPEVTPKLTVAVAAVQASAVA